LFVLYPNSQQKEIQQKAIFRDCDDWALHHITTENHADFPGKLPLKYIAGVDISFVKGDDVNACAALVVVSYPELEVSECFD
jgi:deoxyinosine 3'endonuclease (endonuclease V)